MCLEPLLIYLLGRIQQQLSEDYHFWKRYAEGRKMNVSSQSLFVSWCGNVSQIFVACYSVMKQLPSFLTITFAMYLCVLLCFWMEDFSHLLFHEVRRKSEESNCRGNVLPGNIQLIYWSGLWGLHWTRSPLMPEFAARGRCLEQLLCAIEDTFTRFF